MSKKVKKYYKNKVEIYIPIIKYQIPKDIIMDIDLWKLILIFDFDLNLFDEVIVKNKNKN
jgi:hypothetical protein